jgi:hypothetical protein
MPDKGMGRDTLEADGDLVICGAVNERDEASLLCCDLGMKPGTLTNSAEWNENRNIL